MGLLGLNIGYSTRTFIKLCRCFGIFLSQPWPVSPEIKLTIGSIIQNYLLGAASLQDNNRVCIMELQTLLLCFSQAERFIFYGYYVEHVMFESLTLLTQFERGKLQELVHRRIDSSSNPLAAREEYSHIFSCCCHFLALVINGEAASQTESILALLGEISPLAKEVMLYFCLEYIASNEGELMLYYDLPSPKFRTLIRFMLDLLKHFPAMDFTAFLEMAVHRMAEIITEPDAA
jgi:hypothetical protein